MRYADGRVGDREGADANAVGRLLHAVESTFVRQRERGGLQPRRAGSGCPPASQPEHHPSGRLAIFRSSRRRVTLWGSNKNICVATTAHNPTTTRRSVFKANIRERLRFTLQERVDAVVTSLLPRLPASETSILAFGRTPMDTVVTQWWWTGSRPASGR